MSVYDTNAKAVSNSKLPGSAQVYSFQQVLAGAAVALDLKSLANLHRVGNIQGVFIDNSAGTISFSIFTSAGQNIIVPAGYQGVFPLYLSGDNVITINGNGTVNVTLLNFPTPAAVWPTSTQSLPIISNLLQVQDPALEALISGGGLLVNNGVIGNGDIRQSARGGQAFNGSVSAAATTTIIAGAPSAFISAIDVRLSNNALITAGGTLTVTLAFGSAGTIFARSIVLAAATAFGDFSFFSMSGLNLVGTIAADNVLLTLSAALTAGVVEYTIIGGTTGTQ